MKRDLFTDLEEVERVVDAGRAKAFGEWPEAAQNRLIRDVMGDPTLKIMAERAAYFEAQTVILRSLLRERKAQIEALLKRLEGEVRKHER